jgi:hypothetical protein
VLALWYNRPVLTSWLMNLPGSGRDRWLRGMNRRRPRKRAMRPPSFSSWNATRTVSFRSRHIRIACMQTSVMCASVCSLLTRIPVGCLHHPATDLLTVMLHSERLSGTRHA